MSAAEVASANTHILHTAENPTQSDIIVSEPTDDPPENLNGDGSAGKERSSSNASDGSGHNSTRRRSKAKKNKGKISERTENTAVVVGPINDLAQFKELVSRVDADSAVRSYYFREHQNCGFIYFHEEDKAKAARAHLNGTKINDASDVTIKACAPLEYFENEVDALPIPQNSGRKTSVESTGSDRKSSLQSMPASDVTSTGTTEAPPQIQKSRRASAHLVANSIPAGEPACTLVLKNLNFNLKQEKLLEIMGSMGIAPQSVNYHYDQNGTFRGIAFAKYKRLDDATRALEKLSGMELSGRTLRVEYKRRASASGAALGLSGLPAGMTYVPHRLASVPNIAAMPFEAYGETFDPASLDSEQLQIMTELQRFKEDHEATEWSFPPTLTMGQRNEVHMIADYLSLYHVTRGPAEARFVVVSKVPLALPPGHPAAGLSLPNPRQQVRHASYDASMGYVPQSRTAGRPVRQPKGVRSMSLAKDAPFAQPKGPDGSKGFGAGRGRRVSSPQPRIKPYSIADAVIGQQQQQQQQQKPPTPKQSQPPKPGNGKPPTYSGARSASVPVVIVHDGAEFDAK